MDTTKRGLSEVVTNVIIILLVLAAIAIVWSFVRPAIQKGGEGVQGASDCFTAQLEVNSCVRNVTGQTGYNVTINRKVGAGDVQSIKYVFVLTDGTSKVVTVSTPINELDSRRDANLDVGAVSASNVQAAAVLGNGRTCDPVGTPVACS